jgi:hypothetical protein
MCMHMSGARSFLAAAGACFTGTDVPGPARQLQPTSAVRAQQPHASAAILATEPASKAVVESVDAGSRRDRSQPALKLPGVLAPERPESRALMRVASLVEEVIACLDAPVGEPLKTAVARCNAELESCLEAQREQETHASPKDELRGLARQLASEPADTRVIMRRIRRVLGRVDGHSAR